MAKLSDVGEVEVAGKKLPLRIVVQGYASAWQGAAKDADGNPVSLVGSQLTCRVEFMTATIVVTTTRLGTTIAATNFQTLADPPPRQLVVVPAPDQGTDPGRFTMVIPADLYTGEIEPDTDTLPVAVGYIQRVVGTETRVGRFLLAWRRGIRA